MSFEAIVLELTFVAYESSEYPPKVKHPMLVLNLPNELTISGRADELIWPNLPGLSNDEA